jgi:folate-binding protein YgfZ
MVTDLRVFKVQGDEERLLLDVPRPGAKGLVEHLSRFVPPRLARVRDVSAEIAMIAVIGPGASDDLARALAAEPDGPYEMSGPALAALGELDFVVVDSLTVCRTDDVSVPAFDVIGPAEAVAALWQRLRESGVRPVGQGVWQTLRVEAGRPEFGVDMTEDTLPPEAGIQDRAIDHGKGCYTGQEVIVRIRDRGHVNQHLRGLEFGEAPTPAAGTDLFEVGHSRPRGRVTSAVSSPRFGGAIGLGYVRREVAPPAELRLGDPDGPPVRIVELASASWKP